MTTIRLYTQNTNPFSEKVALGLRLKRLPFERVVSDNPEDVRRWSPVTHRLPVLEIDGERVAESAEILARLDELYPEPSLHARDPRTKEAQARLAEWSDSSLLWYWDRWREARYPRPGDEQPASPGLLGRIRSSLGIGEEGLSRVELRELEVVTDIAKTLDDLVGFLGTRPFFHSEQASLADLSVFGMLRILCDGPIPHTRELLEERPELWSYVERMEKLIAKFPEG